MDLSLSGIVHRLSPLRLIGPIFDKELRVSSRRQRNYVLRSVYLILLLIFVVIVWCNLDTSVASPAQISQRMAKAGTQVVTMIVVFQFVALQLLAISMLSTAISDEVSHKTLGVLMCTPINSFQIVMGKLLSKVFQLLLIAGITVPILSVLRVFGGVPWSFILASLCVTVTTVLFTGALSLLFSVRSGQAHGVIIRTLFVLFLFYALLPGFLGVVVQYYLGDALSGSTGQALAKRVAAGYLLSNPWMQMMYQVLSVISPGGGMPPIASYWGYHCLLMLGLTFGILALAVRSVRRVGLSQAIGQLGQDHRGRWRVVKHRNVPEPSAGKIRRVRGACVVWKELRSPLIQGGKKKAWIGLGVAVGAQIIMYLFYWRENLLEEDFTHGMCSMLFLVIGLVGSVFLSATTITSEKETRSWPILLSTPLDDWQILLGKAIGTFRRCLPVWLFLGAHIVLFCLLGFIHPASLLIVSVIVCWVVAFLSGTGLYFGTRFKKTSGAVISNLALILLLWLVLPAVIGVLGIFGSYEALLNNVSFANPVVQTSIALTGLSGTENAQLDWTRIRFRLMYEDLEKPWAFAGMLTLYAGIYIAAGVGFLLLARRRLRKGIFSE
jgi:ABC-type transport system involved in multi-copper enzyme maturation permease subunit